MFYHMAARRRAHPPGHGPRWSTPGARAWALTAHALTLWHACGRTAPASGSKTGWVGTRASA
eukprot:919864-Pyramimonas_sp.AAC.1